MQVLNLLIQRILKGCMAGIAISNYRSCNLAIELYSGLYESLGTLYLSI